MLSVQQGTSADVSDLLQADGRFIGIPQGGIEIFRIGVLAVGKEVFGVLPVCLHLEAGGGNHIVPDDCLIIAQGSEGLGVSLPLLSGEGGRILQQADFFMQRGVLEPGFRILVIRKGREPIRGIGIMGGLVVLHRQLITQIGQTKLNARTRQQRNDCRARAQLHQPGITALAADKVLFIRELAARVRQGFMGVDGQLRFPRGDDLVDGLLAEAGKDLRLFPVAADAHRGVIQVGAATDAHPQAILLIRIAAGHVARNRAQGGQLGRAVQVIGLVGDGILLLPPPDRRVVIPHLFHRDLILVGADVALHRHRHVEGFARCAVQAAAAMDDLRGLLPILGGQQKGDLHADHLQGGQIEQTHITCGVFLGGEGDFPCLNGAGEVNAHHLDGSFQEGKSSQYRGIIPQRG